MGLSETGDVAAPGAEPKAEGGGKKEWYRDTWLKSPEVWTEKGGWQNAEDVLQETIDIITDPEEKASLQRILKEGNKQKIKTVLAILTGKQ